MSNKKNNKGKNTKSTQNRKSTCRTTFSALSS